jgi:hypothetical protein
MQIRWSELCLDLTPNSTGSFSANELCISRLPMPTDFPVQVPIRVAVCCTYSYEEVVNSNPRLTLYLTVFGPNMEMVREDVFQGLIYVEFPERYRVCCTTLSNRARHGGGGDLGPPMTERVDAGAVRSGGWSLGSCSISSRPGGNPAVGSSGGVTKPPPVELEEVVQLVPTSAQAAQGRQHP